ncbi:MAG: response regulator transcription factor [Alphaproteobacteria bacterium]|uniref:Response regulator transcription factor n=1 Tax=Candidatus Nitrobium versatile TaxID=2884831 RepID=A0A953JBJ7_9BACT|nr:response regulator transcription factor [Candidatus Nitrobium versatile]
MSIRVVLADDHPIFREGLAAVLRRHGDIEVAAEAGDGRTALRVAREILPDVVVMDISMPDLNGIEAAKKIATETPGVKVLALSMHSGRQFVEEMFRAGAAGYLLKDCIAEELAGAIRSVAAGQIYVSSRIAEMLPNPLPAAEGSSTAFSRLTSREREVLQLIAEGKNTREIAPLLSISIKTAEAHRQHIMKKLGAQSLAELIKFAVREGLTTL